MGIFANLFGKKLNTSYVRKWAKKQERKICRSDVTGLEGLFSVMIFIISSFDDKNLKAYSGDASLFEIACYFLFETDLWIYNNQAKYRKDIFVYYISQLNKLFSYSLKVDNIPDLIIDRIEKYGEIAVQDNDSEAYMNTLSELVRRTKYNTLPREYSYNNSAADEITSNEIFNDFIALKMSITIFITHQLEPYYQMLNDFFSSADSDNE